MVIQNNIVDSQAVVKSEFAVRGDSAVARTEVEPHLASSVSRQSDNNALGAQSLQGSQSLVGS
jgi:hypothetical protein